MCMFNQLRFRLPTMQMSCPRIEMPDWDFSLEERGNFLYRGVSDLRLAAYFVGAAWQGTVCALTGGIKVDESNESQRILCESEKVVSQIYRACLGVFLPEIAEEIDEKAPSLTEGLTKDLIESAEASAQSVHFFERHVVSRGKYALTAVVAVVARVIISALGLWAAMYSLIPIPCLPGRQIAANVAFRELQFPGLVKDVLFCATRFVNPNADILYNGVE